MIAIDAAMILQIKATIELWFQSSLTMFVIQWKQRNVAKSVLYVETFWFTYLTWCFFIFLFQLLIWLHRACYSSITMQYNCCNVMRQCCLIWLKTCDKIDICSYPMHTLTTVRVLLAVAKDRVFASVLDSGISFENCGGKWRQWYEQGQEKFEVSKLYLRLKLSE